MDKSLSYLLRKIDCDVTDQPNISFLKNKELLTRVGGAKLFPTDTSEIIIERILHALSDPSIGKAYFGELREDKEIQQKLGSIKSTKNEYEKSVFENYLQERKETLFEIKKNDFYEFVSDLEKGLAIKLIAKQNHKLQLTKLQGAKNRTENYEITKDIDQKISSLKKALKIIPDNPHNAKSILNYKDKIDQLDKEKKKLLSDALEDKQGEDNNLGKIMGEIKTLESTIKNYQAIYGGRTNSGETYMGLKENFIKNSIAPLALKDVESKLFTKEESIFQKNLVHWICQEIEKRKLNGPGKNDPKSFAYLSEIKSARLFFLEECDIKEHIFNLLIELVQINFLESCLKKTMKHKFLLFKAPFVDDIRSNTDCILRIYPSNKKNDYIIPIDLKNMYWKEESKYNTVNDHTLKETNVKNHLGLIFQEKTKHTPYATEHILQMGSKTAPLQPYIMKISPSITRSLLLNYLEQLKTADTVKNTTYVNQFMFQAVHSICSKEQNGPIQDKIYTNEHTHMFTEALTAFVKKTVA